jgi:NADPH-dependent 2,4-dienoyl-CoA reductase/sulfur reductase-like enzyme
VTSDGLVIIGGSDAGVMAAVWAKEQEPQLPVTLVVRDAYPNLSICGIPFYVSGETPEWSMLAHRTVDDLEALGLRLLLDHEATGIDPADRRVKIVDPDDRVLTLGYGSLVIGTGGMPVRPALPGIELPGVHLLHTIDEARRLHDVVLDGAKRAVLIGAGYVGTEMADALTQRGVDVTIVEMAPAVLTTFDPDLGEIVGDELTRHGVTVAPRQKVERIEKQGDGSLRVVGSPTLDIDADVVLVAVGVRPASELARDAGVHVDDRGAIVVDRRMATNLERVWAAGDCAHTHHVLVDRPVYLPLGSTAHKQGRIAGLNAAGGDRVFAGSCGTQAVKVFELVAARTGFRDVEAHAFGFDARSATVEVDDHKAYYPGSSKIVVRLTADRRTGRLLGAQIIGAYGAEVSKRIDIVAAALHDGAVVDRLNDLDLSYTPPLSSPWDPIQAAAQEWLRQAHSSIASAVQFRHTLCGAENGGSMSA